jgi:acyl-ACP thioesterase
MIPDMDPSIYQKEFSVSSYELAPGGKARLTTMANYCQEIAYHHANALGFGYHQMKERRTMWLLSRMRILMDRYPAWDEKIQLQTWPSGVDKLFAIRDFRMRDMNHKVLGSASSGWLIVDLDTHRPIRPGAVLEMYGDIIYSEPVFDTPLAKLDLPGDLQPRDRHRVVYSDLDIVDHVNNVKYMEWCINAAKNPGVPDREIRQFEINFMQEAHLGEQVNILSDSAGTFFSLRKSKDDKEVCRASLEWE